MLHELADKHFGRLLREVCDGKELCMHVKEIEEMLRSTTLSTLEQPISTQLSAFLDNYYSLGGGNLKLSVGL